MELLEGEWAGRRKENSKSQRFSVRFSFLERLLVYRRKFTLISPAGLVKSVPYANSEGAFGSCFDGCRREGPRAGQQTRIKSDGTRARSGAGRDLSFTFFVSEVFFGVEGGRILRRFNDLFWHGKVTGA
jgi:hypothetical protein